MYMVGVLFFISGCGSLDSDDSKNRFNISSSYIGSSNVNVRFERDNVNQVVIDKNKQLIWHDSASSLLKARIHSQAKSYCENLNDSNIKEWRLPSLTELNSLISSTKYNGTYIYPEFKHTQDKFYFTSTKFHNSDITFWGVHFQIGFNIWLKSYRYGYVRCVSDL